MATTNDLKNGIVLNIDGQLWTVIEFQHVKPGKGPAFVRTKLKNVLSGKVVDKTFNAGIKVETANVDKPRHAVPVQDGSDFVFMDNDNYDQINIPEATVGDAANFLLESQGNGRDERGAPLYIELPTSVVLEITYTEPGLQGDRSTGGTKPATLETGARSRSRCSSSRAPRSRWTPARRQPRPGQTEWAPGPRHASARSTSCSRRTSGARPGEAARRPPGRAGHRGAPARVHGRPRRGRHRAPADIDELLATYSHGWTIDRMPAVDRALLRIGTWEILFNDDVPDAVAIDEAVDCPALSTDDSPGFVNGLLGRLST